MNQSAVIDALDGIHSPRIIRRVLPEYTERYWSLREGARNAKVYSAINDVKLPE